MRIRDLHDDEIAMVVLAGCLASVVAGICATAYFNDWLYMAIGIFLAVVVLMAG